MAKYELEEIRGRKSSRMVRAPLLTFAQVKKAGVGIDCDNWP